MWLQLWTLLILGACSVCVCLGFPMRPTLGVLFHGPFSVAQELYFRVQVKKEPTSYNNVGENLE